MNHGVLPRITLAVALAGSLATSGMSAAQEKPASTAAEAERLIKAVWHAHLRRCDTSAFEVLDNRVVLELDQPRFHIAPTKLQPPAIQNGYEYQATAIASARRWRWSPLTGSRQLKWSPWQEGQTMTVRADQTGGERERTTVQNAVLQFDLIRRKKTWIANRPLSPLNSDYRAFDPTVAVTVAEMPACERLTGGATR